MQQRPISSSRAPEDHCLINLTEESPEQAAIHSPRKDGPSGHLPVYSCPSSSGLHRKDNRRHWRSASAMCIHIIPVIVLLSLFTLWWFSYPVNLEIKDGRIVGVRPLEMPLDFNRNHVELAVLASATAAAAASQIVPAPQAQKTQNLTSNNETEVHPSSQLINDVI